MRDDERTPLASGAAFRRLAPRQMTLGEGRGRVTAMGLASEIVEKHRGAGSTPVVETAGPPTSRERHRAVSICERLEGRNSDPATPTRHGDER